MRCRNGITFFKHVVEGCRQSSVQMLMHRGNKEAFKAVYIKAAWQRCMRYYGKWHWLRRVDPRMVGGRNMG
jgi:hypothetical protein